MPTSFVKAQILGLLTLLGVLSSATAQVPGILSHQGKLTILGTNFSGAGQFKFALITTNVTGDEVTLWSHDGTSLAGAEPTGSPVPLGVIRGVFSVNLGDLTVTNMLEPISPWVFTNAIVSLRIWVDDGVNGSQRLAPDRRLANAGYALIAGGFVGDASNLTNLPAGQLTGTLSNVLHFTGPLIGDITGGQSNNVVSTVGGVAAASVASGAIAASTALSTATPNTLAKRDENGDIAARRISASLQGDASSLSNLQAPVIVGTLSNAVRFTGPLGGDLSGRQSNSVVSSVGGVAAADVATGASAANTGASANYPGTIVRRDPSLGNFAAGRVNARLHGDGSGLTNLPTSPSRYNAPAGAMLASLSTNDPILLAQGYRMFMGTTPSAWANGSASNAPSARSGHTAVWDGTEMIVWGGLAGSGAYSGSGGMYLPASDSWASVAMIGAPSARSGHTAVWTGTEMIVWGGTGNDGYLGTGARFNPSTQTWNPVATANAPAERDGHVAVWTGTYMIVWGGRNLTGLLQNGAIYNPTLNQWTSLSLTNPPEQRFGAAAVWGGDRMMVWGGVGEAGELGTGAEMVFSNSLPAQWLAMTSTNAPYPRSQHTAVWAGDRMIVWGGQVGGLPFNEGAEFCPSCGQWRTVASTNSPEPRYGHAAVWTGAEMLIAGGTGGSGDLSSSAAYDPMFSQWRTLTTSGSPLARTGLTAVWIGTQIVLFGGQTSSLPLASVQRLSPLPVCYFYRKL